MRTDLVILFGLLLLGGGTAAAQEERAITALPPPIRLGGGLSAQEEMELQSSVARPPAGPSIARRAFGLTEEADGRLLGGGPDYRVEFVRGGPVVTPALGADAPRSLPFAFELETASLGSAVLAEGRTGLAARAGEREVVYLHDGDLEERYEVRRDGVEQSFVFHALPGGEGDLVVRGLVTTELAAPEPTAEGGLLFRAPNGGGIRVGPVLGIDANGRTASGSVRWRESRLELALPGEFVATAALPLVLDPLIGPETTVGTGLDELDPDVAFEMTQGVYLVVWTREYSSVDFDTHAQRVADDGTLVGGLLVLEGTASPRSLHPAVGTVTLSDRFLVAWQESALTTGPYDIRCRGVSAATGALSNTVTVSNDPADEIDPDVGGDAATGDDEALVVWHDVSQGIRLAQVTLNVVGADPLVFGEIAVSTDTRDLKPSITKSGGGAGIYVVSWQRFFSTPAPGDHDILVRLVSKDSVALTLETLVASLVGPDEEDPDCDGEDDLWLIAYETETTAGSGDNDIMVRELTWDGVTLFVGSELAVEADGGDDEVDPAVGWTGSAWIVAYSDEVTSSDYDVLAEVVVPGPALCGPEVGVQVDTSVNSGSMEIATERSGSVVGVGREAMLAWQDLSTTSPFAGEITGNFFRTDTGLVTDLGGGCGGGGTAKVYCGVVGHAGFVHRLEDANPLQSAFLVLGFSELNVTCGTCKVVPNPFESLLFTTLTDSNGDASVAMPIPADPNLVGATFIDQWVVLGGSACSAFSSDLSNALRVVIQ